MLLAARRAARSWASSVVPFMFVYTEMRASKTSERVIWLRRRLAPVVLVLHATAKTRR